MDVMNLHSSTLSAVTEPNHDAVPLMLTNHLLSLYDGITRECFLFSPISEFIRVNDLEVPGS